MSVARVIWASAVPSRPKASPGSAASAAQSSLLASAALPLKRSARLRISSSKALGRPCTPMALMPAATPVQLRSAPPPSLTEMRSRLAPVTLKPIASSVSRPVTLPSASSTKAPSTPTKKCMFDSDRRMPVALARVIRPSLPFSAVSWSNSNSPAASTKPRMFDLERAADRDAGVGRREVDGARADHHRVGAEGRGRRLQVDARGPVERRDRQRRRPGGRTRGELEADRLDLDAVDAHQRRAAHFGEDRGVGARHVDALQGIRVRLDGRVGQAAAVDLESDAARDADEEARQHAARAGGRERRVVRISRIELQERELEGEQLRVVQVGGIDQAVAVDVDVHRPDRHLERGKDLQHAEGGEAELAGNPRERSRQRDGLAGHDDRVRGERAGGRSVAAKIDRLGPVERGRRLGRRGERHDPGGAVDVHRDVRGLDADIRGQADEARLGNRGGRCDVAAVVAGDLGRVRLDDRQARASRRRPRIRSRRWSRPTPRATGSRRRRRTGSGWSGRS